jgi:hypothetical protein
MTALQDVTDVTDVTLPRGKGRTPSDGERLLYDLHACMTEYVAFPSEAAADAVAAWIMHTWCLDYFDTTPRLALLSPEPGSGKTRALEVMDCLVRNPMQTINVSTSYLFRSMVQEDDLGRILRPTVLLDEADTIFGYRASRDNEDLRGFINGGYRRGAKIGRNEIRGKTIVPVEFPSFAAVAIAGLDDLPDTVMTRSIVIRMRRRRPDERVSPYRRRHFADIGHELGERIDAWCAFHEVDLTEPVREFPPGIEDRAADIWEPLIAIGDCAGGEWRERIRAAAVELVGASQSNGETLGIRLLSDIRQAFGDQTSMTTSDLLAALNGLDDSPWGDIRGRALDARSLSRRLRRYDIASRTIRRGETVAKGYHVEDLHDAWTRYLPAHPQGTVTSVTTVTEVPLDFAAGA